MTSTTPGKQVDLTNSTSAILKMSKVGTERVKTEFLTSYKFDQIDYEERSEERR